MRIVNPTFGRSSIEETTSGVPTIDWLKDPIILFGNNKPNGKELLLGVGAKLSEVRGPSVIDFITKPEPTRGADPAMIDEVAQKYKVALHAMADCGSCSSWSFHDSLELRKRGLLAIVLTTETFRPLVLAQAKARKVEPLLITVKHPVGGLNEEELKERIEEAYLGLQEFQN